MGPRGQGSGRIASHKPIHHYWASPRNGSVCTAPGLLICPDCISNTLCFAEGDSLLTYDWGVNTKKMRGTGMLWCLRLGWNLLGYCSSRPKCLLWPLGQNTLPNRPRSVSYPVNRGPPSMFKTTAKMARKYASNMQIICRSRKSGEMKLCSAGAARG